MFLAHRSRNERFQLLHAPPGPVRIDRKQIGALPVEWRPARRTNVDFLGFLWLGSIRGAGEGSEISRARKKSPHESPCGNAPEERRDLIPPPTMVSAVVTV